MPNLDKILAMDAQYRKEYPRTYNAKDMLLRGHLTAEEFDCVTKGEAMEKYIDNNPEAAGEKKGIILTGIAPAPKTETDKLVEQAEEYIGQAIQAWVPRQLDHVVVRAAVRDKPRLDDPNRIRLQIGFKLFNVLEQTVQEVATDVAVEREVLHMDEHTAKQYWVMFNQCLVNQLTQIVLQLIHGIKAGQF